MNIDKFARGVAAQDEKAFEELYHLMSRVVFSVCLGIVGERIAAEDLTQETFITVWNQSAQFHGVGYKSWILTIAKNKSLNFLARRKKEYPLDEAVLGAAIYDEGVDVETGMMLKAALSMLEQQERQIVLMRNAGLKMKEIAAQLGIPRGTASWRYTEALKKLKKHMEVRV